MNKNAAPFRVYVTHRSALVDYATSLVGERSRAEDVVQEAFTRCLPGDGMSSPRIEKPVAYLYRVVRNIAFDMGRRNAVEMRQQQDEPLWWMIPEVPRTPEEEIVHQENLRIVADVLGRLSPVARLAVEMHRFDGYTLDEVADMLGISPTKAQRYVHKALFDLAKRLKGRVRK